MQGKRGQGRPLRSAQEEEGRFRSLVENSLEGVGLTQGGKVLFANPAFLKMYGYERLEEVLNRSITDLVAPESRDHVLNLSLRREAGEVVPSHYEYRGIRKDGTLIDVEVMAARVLYGGRAAVQATFREITERKRLEAELNTSAEALRRRNAQLGALNSAVRVLSGVLGLKDLHAEFVEHIRGVVAFDHAAVSLLEDDWHFRHLSTGELVTAPAPIGEAGSATDWVVKHRQPLIRQDLLSDGRFRVSERTRALGILSDILVPLVSRGRVVGTLSLASREVGRYQETDLEFLLPLADQLAVSVDNARLYRDLNRAYEDLKAIHDQVVESEKLRALSEMAGGMAHNFNNLLTGILGYAQLLQMDRDTALHMHGLTVIEKSAREGARLVREMQEFARAQSERPFVNLDLNRVIARSLQATESVWKVGPAARGVGVEVSTRLENIPLVHGDEASLAKVISNLVVNAVEAMPEGGAITVSTQAADVTQWRDGWNPQGEGGRGTAVSGVILKVSDTGVGMRAGERERIFQPFYTTKGPQIGFGLGLSVVHGVIVRHQGRIEVDSLPGKGTTFTIWLPAAQGVERATPPGSPDGGQARVLIVDDDVTILEILARMLKPHRVDTAEDGQRGLAAFEQGRHEVVITDLVMPGLNGWDVARAVRQMTSETRVVLMTGWGVDLDARQVREIGVDGVLRKPFDVQQVREVFSHVWAPRTGEAP